MKKIDLMRKEGSQTVAAFSNQRMADAGVDNADLSVILGQAFTPIASLLADGKGVAVVLRGEDASVIGLDIDQAE